MRSKSLGFSLLETLISMAIVAILAALYMPALIRARHKAEQVGVISSMRQDYIGNHATGHGTISTLLPATTDLREICRAAYRQRMSDGSGEGDIYVTEMRMNVRTEAEFRAYWHTLIDPDATEPLEYTSNGELIAKDEAGNIFYLSPPRDNEALVWEFLSTDMSETSSKTMGTVVRYGDGHVQYRPYPSGFPACRAVAEYSHRYLEVFGEGQKTGYAS